MHYFCRSPLDVPYKTYTKYLKGIILVKILWKFVPLSIEVLWIVDAYTIKTSASFCLFIEQLWARKIPVHFPFINERLKNGLYLLKNPHLENLKKYFI